MSLPDPRPIGPYNKIVWLSGVTVGKTSNMEKVRLCDVFSVASRAGKRKAFDLWRRHSAKGRREDLI
jgi:hypothetical protein